MKIRRTYYLILVALTVSISTTVSAAESIRANVNDLLSRRFVDVELTSFVDEVQPLRVDKEVSAPLTTEYACSAIRVIRLIESIENGECTRCLRLEFEPLGKTARFVLSTIVFDYEVASRREAETFVRTLLRGAGEPGRTLDFPTRRSAATFSDSWTLSGEMRSVTARIERRGARWHIWFTHRRDEVPGVPATPR